MNASPSQWRAQSVLGTALALWVLLAGPAAAQPLATPPQPLPPQPPACLIGGLPSCLPTLPDQVPRPPAGKGAITSFIDSLSVKDVVFEVVVGEGRILTLKEDIVSPKKGRP